MEKRNLSIMMVVIVIALLGIGCGGAAAPGPKATPEPHPGQALVSERCTTCHDLSRTESTRLSPEGWQVVVDKMLTSGASLNKDEEAQVVDYLAKTYPNQ